MNTVSTICFSIDIVAVMSIFDSESCPFTLCNIFVGDPYFIEYLEPNVAYNMIIRAMSEVGDGEPLTYVVTTPDVCKFSW